MARATLATTLPFRTRNTDMNIAQFQNAIKEIAVKNVVNAEEVVALDAGNVVA